MVIITTTGSHFKEQRLFPGDSSFLFELMSISSWEPSILDALILFEELVYTPDKVSPDNDE